MKTLLHEGYEAFTDAYIIPGPKEAYHTDVLLKERDGKTSVMDDGIENEHDDDDSDFIGSRSKKPVKNKPQKEDEKVLTWHYCQAIDEDEDKASKILRNEAVKAAFEKYLNELGADVVFEEQITCDG